jgi:hypothetical protein
VEVAPVEDEDVDGLAGEGARGLEPREARPDNDDSRQRRRALSYSFITWVVAMKRTVAG